MQDERVDKQTHLVETCGRCGATHSDESGHECSGEQAEAAGRLTVSADLGESEEGPTAQTIATRTGPPRHPDTESLPGKSLNQPPALSIEAMRVASFWDRIRAMLLDGAIFGSLIFGSFTVAAMIFIGTASVAPQASGWFWQTLLNNAAIICALGGSLSFQGAWPIYVAFMESSKYQATFGMSLSGLKSVTLEGRRLSFWHAVWRAIAEPILQTIAPLTLFMVPVATIPAARILGWASDNSPYWSILMVTMLATVLAALAFLYVPLFRRRSQTLIDLVSKRIVVAQPRETGKPSLYALKVARATVFLVAPYIVAISYYFVIPSYVGPLFNHQLMRSVLTLALIFHICGLPLAFVLRRSLFWCLLGVIYVIPAVLIIAIGPLALPSVQNWVHKPGMVGELWQMDIKLVASLILIWLLCAPELIRLKQNLTVGASNRRKPVKDSEKG